MTIKNILLIMPPFSMKERYGRGIEKIGSSLPPLGLLYVGGALEKAGYSVKIFDTQISDWDIKKAGTPDIVGIYCNTSNYHKALELAKEIKDNLGILVVFGGPHVTTRPIEVLKNDCVDYAVIGEGEESVVELLGSLNNPETVRGIGFKRNGQPIINPKRELIKNLDFLPVPARHLINLNGYKPSPNQYKRLPMTTMMVSRGCPFNCTFCDVETLWTRLYRSRSVNNVIEEMEQLIKNYGIREINFWDDVWGINKAWIDDFCSQVLAKKFDISWSCECRVDTVGKELLKKMKKAGCWCIFFGIESLDQEILNAINKKITVEKIASAFKWTKEAGIEVRANLILGLPKETPENFKRSLKKLCDLNPNYAKFNILTPYPGTQIYREIKEGKWGKILDESYDKLTGYFVTFLPSGYRDVAELEKTRKYAYRKFYLRLGYIVPRLLSIRSFEDLKRYIRGALAIFSV